MSQELLIDLSEICESSYKSVYDIEDQNKIDFANYMEERIMNKFEKLIETKLCLDETKDKRIKELEEIINLQNTEISNLNETKDKRIKELEEIINLQNTEISNLNEKVLLLGNLKNQKESEKKTDDISYDKNDNFKISEVSLNVEDYNYHVKKLIETRKLAKIERMKKFGVMYCEDYTNFTASLTDKDKETIINVNHKLLIANNDVVVILGLKKYSIKPFKTQYNNIEELIEINKENILLFSEYEKLQKKLEQYKNKLLGLIYVIKVHSKRNAYYELKKILSKKRRAGSGLVKPTKISDELASFLGKEKGTEMARTAVTREISRYIRAHKLQDKYNGRKINPDTKLSTLLKLKKNDELTYFNLQRYLAPHFAKNDRKISV